MGEVFLTGNEYLLVYNVFSLVVASMFGAFIYFVLNVSQVSKKYRNAVAVSAVVVAVAGYHYFRIFTGCQFHQRDDRFVQRDAFQLAQDEESGFARLPSRQ